MILLHKKYDGESIVDVSRDVSEAFDADFTPQVKDIPQDGYGFPQGTFTVTIEWASGVAEAAPEGNPPEFKSKFMNAKPSDLELTVRTGRILDATYGSVGRLLMSTEVKLLALEGFGRKSLSEITNVLKSYSLFIGLPYESVRDFISPKKIHEDDNWWRWYEGA